MNFMNTLSVFQLGRIFSLISGLRMFLHKPLSTGMLLLHNVCLMLLKIVALWDITGRLVFIMDSRFHGNDTNVIVAIPAKDLQCQPPKMKEG